MALVLLLGVHVFVHVRVGLAAGVSVGGSADIAGTLLSLISGDACSS